MPTTYKHMRECSKRMRALGKPVRAVDVYTYKKRRTETVIPILEALVEMGFANKINGYSVDLYELTDAGKRFAEKIDNQKDSGGSNGGN